jgi:hypothetical protein
VTPWFRLRSCQFCWDAPCAFLPYSGSPFEVDHNPRIRIFYCPRKTPAPQSFTGQRCPERFCAYARSPSALLRCLPTGCRSSAQLRRRSRPAKPVRPLRARILWSLLTGGIAIAVNTTLLAGADLIPLVTARGGLLKLLTIYFGPALTRTGMAAGWIRLGLPMPGGTTFQLGFHVLVGLAMALLYGVALEPLLPGRPLWKGLLYAAAVWVANAFVVLPWLGEGIAGSHNLGLAGMAYFAAAHTVFFVLLAVLFGCFNRLRR